MRSSPRSRPSSNRAEARRARDPRATPDASDRAGEQPVQVRIDIWLWRARFAKTRGLSARLAQSGHVRLNGRRVEAAGRAVRPGDVLTIAADRTVHVVEIVALGGRRGPASEVQTLYRRLVDDAPQ